jgi:hypothetical protein
VAKATRMTHNRPMRPAASTACRSEPSLLASIMQ